MLAEINAGLGMGVWNGNFPEIGVELKIYINRASWMFASFQFSCWRESRWI
jgi:hypothetical protein